MQTGIKSMPILLKKKHFVFFGLSESAKTMSQQMFACIDGRKGKTALLCVQLRNYSFCYCGSGVDTSEWCTLFTL